MKTILTLLLSLLLAFGYSQEERKHYTPKKRIVKHRFHYGKVSRGSGDVNYKGWHNKNSKTGNYYGRRRRWK